MVLRWQQALVALALGGWSTLGAALPICQVHQFAPLEPVDLPAGQVAVTADALQSDDRDTVNFSGDIQIRTNVDLIRALSATYTHSTGQMQLKDHVSLRRDNVEIVGSRASYNYRQRRGVFADAQFAIKDQNQQLFGSAKYFEQLGDSKVILHDSHYTSCAEPKPAWALVADKITLDRDKDIGSASHLRLHVGGVPIFYFPYLNFPLSGKRKSGLLFPSFGSSNRRGWQYYQPIYWNIAPQADATITPFYASKTGNGVQTGWRYLDQIGTYDAFLDYVDDGKYHKNQRYLGAFYHSGSFGNWHSRIQVARVSDLDYLEHYSNQADIGRADYLGSTLSLGYRGSDGYSEIGSHFYQQSSHNQSARPYVRLPYILNQSKKSLWQQHSMSAGVAFDGRFDNFMHPDRLEAQRWYLAPQLWWQQDTLAYNLGARATVKHYSYFYRNSVHAPKDSSHNSVGVVDATAKVNLERRYQNIRHSVEPELYLLYAQERDQSAQANFDSSRRGFSYDSLFADNRYFGYDRQGDSQQISIGLGNYWHKNADNQLLASVKIAQAFYGKAREVSLDYGAERDNLALKKSDIAVQAVAHLPYHLSLVSEWRYAPRVKKIAASSLKLSYQLADAYKIYAAHSYANRYNSDSSSPYQSVEAGALWQLGSHFELLALGVYDTLNHQNEELALALGYQACCWSLRLSGSQELQADKKTYENQFNLEFTLEGLANIGRQQQSLRARILSR